MKRLLCIVDSMNTGGAETFLMKLYRALDKNKYQMDFIVSGDGFYDDEIRKLGGKVFKIPMRTKSLFGAMNAIRKTVKQNKYNCVMKLGSTPIVALDLLAAKIGGATNLIVRSCNANAEEGTIYKIANVILRPLFNYLVDIKIAPSDLAAEFTFGKKAVQKNQVFFLHNAIDLNVFKYDLDGKNRLIKELNLQGKRIYGHIGRFSNQKNHRFLIDIFEKIYLQQPDSVLILIGQGELEDDIKKIVKQKHLENAIIFLGVRKDIPQILSLMDVFIFPSFYEGMPNTIIEAQATGLNCVISDTITKQAKLTDLLTYMSLEKGATEWAKVCLSINVEKREDTHEQFIKQRYTINDVVYDFTNIVMEKIES